VLGQQGDEALARRHRLVPGEGQPHRVPCAGEGHAGPAALDVMDQQGLAAGQGHDRLDQVAADAAGLWINSHVSGSLGKCS